MEKYVKITQIKSSIGRLSKHKLTLKGLGLKRIRHTVYLKDNIFIRGMIRSIAYMLKIEDV
ncbi:50S ribosomal protein L30 [Buchnera aphidicola (Hormaphis cornu)]|nr:50S ribosomal protein L30 [Buchnera aphidicola (Hormaphis cornu)]